MYTFTRTGQMRARLQTISIYGSLRERSLEGWVSSMVYKQYIFENTDFTDLFPIYLGGSIVNTTNQGQNRVGRRIAYRLVFLIWMAHHMIPFGKPCV